MSKKFRFLSIFLAAMFSNSLVNVNRIVMADEAADTVIENQDSQSNDVENAEQAILEDSALEENADIVEDEQANEEGDDAVGDGQASEENDGLQWMELVMMKLIMKITHQKFKMII